MVWCGAIALLTHRYQYIRFGKSRSRSWLIADEYDMIKTSSSDFVLSRVHVGLQECI